MPHFISGETHRKRGMVLILSYVLALSIAFPHSVLAATNINTSNDTTGPNSTNSNTVNGTTTINFTATNTANTTNNFDLNMNTGGNTVSNNTTVGDITTGDIDFELATDNQLNNGSSNSTSLQSLGQNASFTSTNSTTGPGSTNNNTGSLSSSTTITKTNNATANNSYNLTYNTGDNDISNNTTVGNIRTGDITGRIVTTNILNTNPQGGGNVTPPTGGGDPDGVTPPTSTIINPPTLTTSPVTPTKTVALAPESKVATAAAPAIQTPARAEFFPAGDNNMMPLYAIFFLISFALLQDWYGRRKAALNDISASGLILGRDPQGIRYAPLRGTNNGIHKEHKPFSK